VSDNLFIRDCARFRVEDHDEIVAASLACRFCLRTAVAVDVDRDEFGGVARCHCQVCRAITTITLDHDQVLRLALRPPPNVHIHVKADP